jgi:hAT family C-terminal dimerisation region
MHTLLHPQAHSLDLIIKDLTGANKAMQIAWVLKVYGSAKLMSNVINGNETVRKALHTKMEERYQAIKGISANNPTRFAGLHFIAQELKAAQAAIVDTCTGDGWEETFRTCENKESFIAAALQTGAAGRRDYKYWQHLAMVIELVQPVCDAIHQLECDQPRLSQLLRIWAQLITHAAAFDDKHGLVGDLRTARVFRRRFAIHYQKEWALAYALDPMHAEQLPDGSWRLPLALSSLPVPGALNGEPLRHPNSGAQPGPLVMLADDVRTCLRALSSAGADTEASTAAAAAAVDAELSTLVLGALPAEMAEHLAHLTKRDPVASSGERRGWWSRVAIDHGFPLIAQAAVRLLSCHVTSCATERNWSLWGNIYQKARCNLALERATKLVAIRHNDRSTAAKGKTDEEIVLKLLSDS